MAFLRDVGAYFGACGLLLLLLFNGSFAMSEAALLLLCYAVYNGAAIVTSRCGIVGSAKQRQRVLSVCLAGCMKLRASYELREHGTRGGLRQLDAT